MVMFTFKKNNMLFILQNYRFTGSSNELLNPVFMILDLSDYCNLVNNTFLKFPKWEINFAKIQNVQPLNKTFTGNDERSTTRSPETVTRSQKRSTIQQNVQPFNKTFNRSTCQQLFALDVWVFWTRSELPATGVVRLVPLSVNAVGEKPYE